MRLLPMSNADQGLMVIAALGLLIIGFLIFALWRLDNLKQLNAQDLAALRRRQASTASALADSPESAAPNQASQKT